LGHEICDTTVANILKKHGIEPAPQATLSHELAHVIKAHWDVLSTQVV